MLRNRAALGEYRPQSFSGGDKRAPIGDWQKTFPSIIDEALWAKAQASLSGRRDNPGLVKHTFTNVLTGVARCGICAGPLVLLGAPGTARNGARRLQCKSYKSGHGCTARTSYTYPTLRDAVLDNLGYLLVDPSSGSPAQTELHNARAELQGMRDRVDNLVDALGRNASPSMERAVVQLDARIREQEGIIQSIVRAAAIESAIPSGPDILAQISQLRDGLDADEAKRRHINQLLRLAIDTIILNPSNRHATAVVADGMIAVEFGPDGSVVNAANALNQLEHVSYTLADGEVVHTNPGPVERAITRGSIEREAVLSRAKRAFRSPD